MIDARRQAMNDRLRTLFADRLLDFDAVLRSPDADSLAARFDAGDGLHPSLIGLVALGESIPLTMIR